MEALIRGAQLVAGLVEGTDRASGSQWRNRPQGGRYFLLSGKVGAKAMIGGKVRDSHRAFTLKLPRMLMIILPESSAGNQRFGAAVHSGRLQEFASPSALKLVGKSAWV